MSKFAISNSNQDKYFESVERCFIGKRYLDANELYTRERYVFTDEGKRQGLSVSCSMYCTFKMKQNKAFVPTDIEITGIKDSFGAGGCGTYKDVKFAYIYNGLSDDLNECLDPSGEALIVLYDDGWRVEKVTFRLKKE